MHNDPLIVGLVTRAQHGDQQAWDALVERYAPLVWSICLRYRLNRAGAVQVSQTVWVRLAKRLATLHDPAAVAAWLAAATQRECAQVRRAAQRPADTHAPGAEDIPDGQDAIAEDEVLAAEWHAALREAFTSLPPCCQQLLTLLTADPPVQDVQISANLGISIGSIGPNRSRCLETLRRHPAIAALINPRSPGPAR